MNRPDVAARICLSKVLLATDFSRCSQAALPYAESIANRYGSHLLVAHVVPRQPVEPHAARDERHEGAAEAVRGFLGETEAFLHEVVVRSGDAWEELSEIISTNQIDLLAIGTRGQSNGGEIDLGSTARQALRHAPCPVLTVGPHVSRDPMNGPEIREVLYPADLEPETSAAAVYAVSLASEYRAHLSLLHAAQKQNGASPDSLTQRLYDSISCGGGLLHRPTAFVKYGPPVERILEAEHERGADLIVLGAQRTDRFSEAPAYLAWSAVERIVTQAHCPVLTISS
jgi:nucleotide-binding universal stress UspA family protein